MSTATSKRLVGAGGLVVLAILFLGVVMLSNQLIRGMRLDLTQNKLFTLTEGTRQTIAEIKEPVNLYFYFSREAASKQAPLMLPYANRVSELLEEIAARSGGKIHLRNIDPKPFSDEEDRAAEFGLTSLSQGGGDSLYFGLAGTNSTDGRSVIPAFTPDREQFLEYDIAKLLHELANPKKPVIGLLSSLPMRGQFNPQTGQMGESWAVLSQLEQLFTIRTLSPEADRIESDVDVLMLVHPKNLSQKALYAIDQFVMRGGRLLAFVDPNASTDSSGQDPRNPMSAAYADHSSNLAPLFAAWGVKYDPHLVIGDARLGLQVRSGTTGGPTRHIGILGLHHDDMDTNDVVTANLDTINMATVGFFTHAPGSKSQFTPLLLSSNEAAPIPANRFSMLTDPSTLLDGFKATGQRYVLAARLTGSLPSAFPKGPPAADKTPGPPTANLAVSKTPANVVIVADTDLLSDFLWVQTRELFGQRFNQAFANNGDLVANILDNLGGSNALIGIRGRATFSRPFERVEALKRNADDRLRAKVQQLQAELKQTESRLTQLQAKRNDQSSLVLTPEQEAELKRFTAEKSRIRKELRETQRGLDVDIERLSTWLKIINIGLVPLLVAIAGFLVLAARRRRRSTGAA